MRPEFHDASIATEVVGKTTKLGVGSIRKLTAFLRTERSQIVHTHLFGGDTWGRIAAFRAGVPHVISTEHNINRDEGFVKRFVKRRLAGRTERIIAVSDAVRAHSLRADHIPSEKLIVIPNGVDLERFRLTERPPRDLVRILSVGRLVPQKGHDVLLDAFAVLRDTLPRARLTIIGDGPLRPHLEEQIRAYRIGDRVQLLGFHRDLPEFYARADIAAFPSRWEGLGLAAIEASACGLPVIASAVGGLHEVVRDQETGVLVPSEEPKLLAEAIVELVRDRARRVLMGHAGRRHVERQFDIRKVVERYERLYQSLVIRK